MNLRTEFLLIFSLVLFLPPDPSIDGKSLKGQVYPAEWREFSSLESGNRVVQLTTDLADDSGLYFTNNGFVPHDHGLVFASRRTGRWNLFYMDLETGKFIQLTDGPNVKATGAVVSPITMEAYYVDARELKAVHLKTLVERTIYSLPLGYSPNTLSVSSEGKVVAFSFVEIIPMTTKTDKIYSDMAERFVKRPWSTVITVNTDGSGWHEVLREKLWLSHVLINPKDPKIILYCQEGPWEKVPQRMWLINSDGTGNHPLRLEEKPEVRIGHEYWFKDGIHVGYQASFKGQQKSIGIANSLTGVYKEYSGANDTHTQANSHGTLFVGDGNMKEPYINLYRIENNHLILTRLLKHGGTYDQQYYHPHPIFTPDDQSIFFTSNRDGNGNIYILMFGTNKRLTD